MSEIKNHIFLNSKNNKRNFDIPLQQRIGTEFLVMLIALMTVLATLSGLASLSLAALSNGWEKNLQNNLTIEIPATTQNRETATQQAEKILPLIKNTEIVESAEILKDADYEKLLSPWLGAGITEIDDLPLPILINVTLKNRDKNQIEKLSETVKSISPDININANENWLNDLSALARSVNIAAMLLIVFIGLVTILSISGAVRSRMAVHQSELQLLHLMGASDNYILKQFRHYILNITIKGIAIGMGMASLFIICLWLIGNNSTTALPHISFKAEYLIVPPLVFLFMTGLCLLSSKRTVLRVLQEMP